MNIRVTDEYVEIEGYVNAVERLSKELYSPLGLFRERICEGAFSRAIKRNDEIYCLLNHDWDRSIADTKTGTLTLTENSIGCYATVRITDREVRDKAREGHLVGWSFGFEDRDVEVHEENGVPVRDVKDMELYEVSLLDDTRTPAYSGTLVSVRSGDGKMRYFSEPSITEAHITDETLSQQTAEKVIDYSSAEQMIRDMKEL